MNSSLACVVRRSVVLLAIAVVPLLGAARMDRADDDRRGGAAQGRFTFLDVFVDPGSHRLGAYQVDLRVNRPGAAIIGIEGGDGEAFKEPPFYDPKAIQNNRVILGAFNLKGERPAANTGGGVRVARVHLRIVPPVPPSPGGAAGGAPIPLVDSCQTELTAAADDDGTRITQTTTVRIREGEAK